MWNWVKLESELLEKPLVFARLVPENKQTNKIKNSSELKNFQLEPHIFASLKLKDYRKCVETDLSSNLTLASRLAFRLRAGSLNTSLFTTVLSRGISTEYLRRKQWGNISQVETSSSPLKKLNFCRGNIKLYFINLKWSISVRASAC